jgi:eukaryotic-like serine/threonine-protein kinase
MDGQSHAPERGERIRSAFLEALATDPSGRALVLDRACGSDAALRQEVELLLAASGDADEFLGDLAQRAIVPLADVVAAGGVSEPLTAGRRLGAYRLIRELGRGGMGAVYLAERADEQYEKERR